MRWLGWFVAAVAVGLAVARFGLVLADQGAPPVVDGMPEPEAGVLTALADVLLSTVFVAVGAVVATRRARNPLGWLLEATGLGFAVLLFTERLGWHLLVNGHDPALVLWIADWSWVLAVIPIFIPLPLLFPNGRAFSPALLRFAAVACVIFWFALAFAGGTLENYPTIESPFGAVGWLSVVRDISFAVVIVIALLSVGTLALRFRRSTGVERQQIKWVWAAAAALVVTFVIAGALQNVAGLLSGLIQIFGLLTIPVAVAFAILRHRLYDIDVVVNRTLVYGGLTAILVAVYIGTVLLCQLVLSPQSSLAIAASTLAVAGLFNPVRVRLQALVDRRFYRRKYDAERMLELFSVRLRDEIDLDTLVVELGGLLEETVQPAHISLWLRPSGAPAASSPS